MRVLITAVLFSVVGGAQAFNVNVITTERIVQAGLLLYPEYDEALAPANSTGSWVGDVEYYAGSEWGDYATASIDVGINPSGSYTTYNLSMSGDYALVPAGLASRTSNNVGVFASLETTFTLDQAATWEFDCGGYMYVDGPSGIFSVTQCFDGMGTGTFSAGTYHIYIESGAWARNAYALNDGTLNANLVLTAVPVPAAVWLFGSGLGVLGWMRGRRGLSRRLWP